MNNQIISNSCDLGGNCQVPTFEIEGGNLSKILQLSKRGFNKKIKAENWSYRESTNKNGIVRLYDFSKIPQKSQIKVICNSDEEIFEKIRNIKELLSEEVLTVFNLEDARRMLNHSENTVSSILGAEYKKQRKKKQTSEKSSFNLCSRKIELKKERVKGMAMYESLSEAKKEEIRLKYDLAMAWKAEREKPRGQKIKFDQFAVNMLFEKGELLKKHKINWDPQKRSTYFNLQRWIHEVDKGGIAALADLRGRGKGVRSVNKWAVAWIENNYLHRLGYVTPVEIWEQLHIAAAGCQKLKNPETVYDYVYKKPKKREKLIGLTTTRKIIEQIEEEHKDYLSYFRNPDKYRSTHAPAIGSVRNKDLRCNDIWEMDSSPFDLMALKPVPLIAGEKPEKREASRYHLVSCVDVASGLTMMTLVDRSNAVNLMRFFHKCIKKMGIPKCVKIDHGKDYTSNDMQESFNLLSVRVEKSRPYRGDDKPFVERAFGVFQGSFSKNLTGYIGNNVAKRVELEAQISKQDRLSGSQTNLEYIYIAEELKNMIERWFESVQPKTYNRGLEATPEDIRHRDAAYIEPVKNPHEIAYAFGRKYTRTVGKKGITVDRRTYISDKLAAHSGKSVETVIDPDDATLMYVFADGEFVTIAESFDVEAISAELLHAADKEYKKKIRRLKEARKLIAENAETGDLALNRLEVAEKDSAVVDPAEINEAATKFAHQNEIAGAQKEDAARKKTRQSPKVFPALPEEKKPVVTIDDYLLGKKIG